jgi:hypothetical protein
LLAKENNCNIIPEVTMDPEIKESKVRISSDGHFLEGAILQKRNNDGLNSSFEEIGFVVTHPMPMFGGNMKNNVRK